MPVPVILSVQLIDFKMKKHTRVYVASASAPVNDMLIAVASAIACLTLLATDSCANDIAFEADTSAADTALDAASNALEAEAARDSAED